MKRVLVIIMLSFLCLHLSYAAQEGVDEIISKSDQAVYYAGGDAICQIQMKLFDKKGQVNQWEFLIDRKNYEGGIQKYKVSFMNPPFLKDLAYVSVKYPGGKDQRWLYVIPIDVMKKIEDDDSRVSFFGAAFSYEDISGRDVNADTHELMDINGGHYVLKNIPKDGRAEDFVYYLVWIRQSDYIPVKVEFYDKDNLIIKLIEILTIEDIEGIPTITKTLIKDLKSGSEAEIQVKMIDYGVELADDIFEAENILNL